MAFFLFVPKGKQVTNEAKKTRKKRQVPSLRQSELPSEKLCVIVRMGY
jgi:hypothetical protein